MSFFFILTQLPEGIKVPGAIDTLLQTSAIFAIMAVIVFVVSLAGWRILNKYLSRLEADSDQTKKLEDIEDNIRRIDEKLQQIILEVMRKNREL